MTAPRSDGLSSTNATGMNSPRPWSADDQMRTGITGAVDDDPVARGVAALQQPTNRQTAADDVHHTEQPERGAGTKRIRPASTGSDAEHTSNGDQRDVLKAAAASSNPMKRTTER